MFEEREFQTKAHELTLQRVGEGHAPIVCSPTGSGKTVMEARLAKHFMDAGKRVMSISFREEILDQMFRTYTDVCGLENVGYLKAGKGPWWMYPRVTVASADTLKARWENELYRVPADVLLIDEAHLSLAKKMCETVMAHYRPKIVIGFTATPARKTGRGLGSYFTRIIQVATVQQLIDQGYLAPCEYWAGSHVDTSKLAVDKKTNDFKETQLAAESMEGVLIGDVIDNWLRLASDRHTIVFAVDIAHAQALTERFQAAGVKAEVLHSKLTHDTRARLTQKFRERQFDVLVNVGIATYGFDVPSIGCVVLAKPTKSIVLHHQMIGRGIRPKPDGGYCMVLDHADNVRRLGCIEDNIRWRLDEGKEAATNVTREGDVTRQQKPEEKPTNCGKCGHMFSRSRVCPKCGWEKPATASDIETIDADLVRVAKAKSEAEAQRLERREWYLMSRQHLIDLGKNPGAAYHRYKEKFKGEAPPSAWNAMELVSPSPRVVAEWHKYRRDYARRRSYAERARA